MAVVTVRAHAAVTYSSDAAAQEVRSRRSSFTPVRDTGDHVFRLGAVVRLCSRDLVLPA